MITPTQMRAARAMLDVSQGHVADHLGIAANTLSKIESGQSDVSVSRNTDIQNFYEREGIAFADNDAVKWDVGGVVIYNDRGGFLDFMDDVYETAKAEGGDIYLFNSKPRLWHEWLGEEWYQMHSDRMKALGDKVNVKITVEEGDDVLILKTAEHKWFPKGLYKNKIFYAYGDKLAFLDFEEESVKITVVKQKEFTDIFRVLYDVAWEKVATKVVSEI